MIENKVGLKPSKKNGVLVYIGNREFFKKQLKDTTLFMPETDIDNIISNWTKGVIIEKGSEAFKDHDIQHKIGDVITFQGYFGQMYSCEDHESPILAIQNNKNRAYYRLMADKDIEASYFNENK